MTSQKSGMGEVTPHLYAEGRGTVDSSRRWRPVGRLLGM